MKRLFVLAFVLIAGCTGNTAGGDSGNDSWQADSGQGHPEQDFTGFVNPMIGTKGQGNVVPGPCMPHGMMKLSPDTAEDSTSIHAYNYSNNRLAGFSCLHREGPGGSGNGYAQLLLMATTGDLKVHDYASAYSHDQEEAKVGYYKVDLLDYGITAELTALRQAGIIRYTFNRAGKGHILIDLGHCRGVSLDAQAKIEGNNLVKGWAAYQVYPIVAYGVSKRLDNGTGMDKVYFAIKADSPFETHGVWQNKTVKQGQSSVKGDKAGVFLDYTVKKGQVIRLKVGISMISEEQAIRNLDEQVGGLSFDAVQKLNKAAWNDLLGRIEVSGSTRDKVRFYTALYHSLMQPADYTEDGKFFSAADGKGDVFQAKGHDFYTDDWCIWDTFRTTHPLLTIVEPEVVEDTVWSLVHLYKTGGWLPKCTWNATGYSRVMTGNPQFCVIAEAYLKGFKDFDADEAWAGILKGSWQDNDNALSQSMCGYLDLGTPPPYRDLGYIPDKCDRDQSVSLTLELAHADWCAAVLGKALGYGEASEKLAKRSKNWRNVFNPEQGMMQRRDKTGKWVEPFDPLSGKGFTEANSWQYTWFVPHEPCELVKSMGGKQGFLYKLDEFFDKKYFTIDNEPDFHTPWLYDVVGRTGEASRRIDLITAHSFTDQPDGLPGNDDAGATSAWFVFASLGLYPVNPPDRRYWLNTPIFEKVVIHVDPRHWDKTFVINAPGANGKRFIREARLNGEPTKQYITHEQIVKGGVLDLKLSDKPVDFSRNICN